MENVIEIFTDGGSRGNPGPAASAFVVYIKGEEIAKGSEYLGKATNNQAEYKAVSIALNWLSKNEKVYKDYRINFTLDSELVVRQINRIYKVKNEEIKKIYQQIIADMEKLPMKFMFTSVLRHKNKVADSLVNKTLDEHKI